MPPKKKVQAKSVEKDDDHSEEEVEKTTKAKGRGKSKDDSKEEATETRRSSRISKAQADTAKNGKKKADNSPDDETQKKKASKKVKGGKKKDMEPEDDEEDEEDDEEEDDKGKGSKKESAKMVTAVTKGGVAVDNFCDLKSKAHVYIDSAAKKVYAATLNQSNIKKNNNKVDFASFLIYLNHFVVLYRTITASGQ